MIKSAWFFICSDRFKNSRDKLVRGRQLNNLKELILSLHWSISMLVGTWQVWRWHWIGGTLLQTSGSLIQYVHEKRNAKWMPQPLHKGQKWVKTLHACPLHAIQQPVVENRKNKTTTRTRIHQAETGQVICVWSKSSPTNLTTLQWLHAKGDR